MLLRGPTIRRHCIRGFFDECWGVLLIFLNNQSQLLLYFKESGSLRVVFVKYFHQQFMQVPNYPSTYRRVLPVHYFFDSLLFFEVSSWMFSQDPFKEHDSEGPLVDSSCDVRPFFEEFRRHVHVSPYILCWSRYYKSIFELLSHPRYPEVCYFDLKLFIK